MENKLKEKYGLLTAICLVVGIVIGSGVFFKAEKVLNATGGNLPLGILAWGVGGMIMIICAYTFSTLATRYSFVNGALDYAENIVGDRYGYFMGWFMATIYYPAMTSVLAWVSARYLCVLLGWDITGGACMAISGVFLISAFALNTLGPILAGKFQVSTTIIKLIPLLLMGLVGLVVGLSNGMTMTNFTTVVDTSISPSGGFLAAVVATAFAYEGWIIATSINAELKDPKKNLPKALVLGTITVAVVYILYYVGIAGGISNADMMEMGAEGTQQAFVNLFSSIGGTALFVFVIISCLGTLNGLTMACSRGMYSLAVRNRGPKPELLGNVDRQTNMPVNSAVMGLVFCGLWLVYFYGAQLASEPWFGAFSFDSSELPIVTIYGMYIPIFIMVMIREKSEHWMKRFVMPGLSIICCLFMIAAAFIAHGVTAVTCYIIVFAVILLIGAPFLRQHP